MDSMWTVFGQSKNVFIYTYTLDTKGRVVSRNQAGRVYINGNLIGGVSSSTMYLTWQNDNLVKTVESGVTFSYTYDETLTAAMEDQFTDIYNQGQSVYSANKNQIKKMVYTDAVNGFYSTQTYNYDD